MFGVQDGRRANPDMTEPDTEARVAQSQWLDSLDDSEALRVMLASQAGAARAVEAALLPIAAAVEAMTARLVMNDSARIIYAGAGTSIRVAVQDGVELRPTFDWPSGRVAYLVAGGHGALMSAVENAEDDVEAARDGVRELELGPSDILIALSASGGTPFTCAAVDLAAKTGALTVGIANNDGSPLLAKAEIAIPILTGAEAVAGSTRLKAATAQKICLNMISTLVMTRLGYVRDGQMIAMKPSNAKLRARYDRIHGDGEDAN